MSELRLPVWDYHWDNGERHTELTHPEVIPELPREFTNLMNRRRTTLSPSGTLQVMTIAAIKFTADGWPTACKTTDAERRARCGERRWQQGTGRYARTVGTKEEVLSTDGRNRTELCATFDDTDTIGPVWMYTVTRILPAAMDLGVIPTVAERF